MGEDVNNPIHHIKGFGHVDLRRIIMISNHIYRGLENEYFFDFRFDFGNPELSVLTVGEGEARRKLKELINAWGRYNNCERA